jgi:hypothetical protein
MVYIPITSRHGAEQQTLTRKQEKTTPKRKNLKKPKLKKKPKLLEKKQWQMQLIKRKNKLRPLVVGDSFI